MTDLRGLLPEWTTARDIAARTGWETTYAIDILNQLWVRGMVEKDGDRYRITGLGMAIGEKMGIAVPIENVPQLFAGGK